MQHTSDEIKCEECNGTGRDRGGLSAFEYTECPVCMGYGSIVIEEEAEINEEAA